MRFTTEVKFYSESKQHYDPDTSQMVGGEELVADVFANVTDMGTTKKFELFGALNTNIKVIRLVEPLEVSWSYCLIGDSSAKYIQQTEIVPIKSSTLIVGENHG
jgi:hypothetical protein